MAWLRSAEFEQLQREIVAYEEKYAINDEATAVAAFQVFSAAECSRRSLWPI